MRSAERSRGGEELEEFLAGIRRWTVWLILCGAGLASREGLAQTEEGAVIHVTPPPKERVLTKPPELLHGAEPIYPEEAKAAQLTGNVTLQIDIDATGHVSDVKVLQSAGHGFDEAAVEAAKQFIFSPAEIDGHPAPVRVQHTQHFVFTQLPTPSPPSPPQFPVSIQGRVSERATRRPVIGAAVKVNDLVVTTDEKGGFSLRLPPGTVDVSVIEPRYRPFQTHETLREGERIQVTYYLMPKEYRLFETIVTAERDKKEVTRRTLEREELQKVPGSLGDPIRVIQDMPGVARAPFLGGQLIVRGSSPNDTGSYFDGVQVPLLYHFNGGPSVINPEFVDRIDFFPGGFGAQYGRAIGGIVDIQTRSPKEREWHGSAKIDLLDAGAYLSFPLGDDWTVSAAVRRSYIDLVLPIFLSLTNSSAAVTPIYYDYQLRADYRPKGSRSSVKFFFFGSDDSVKIASGGTSVTDFQLKAHAAFQRLVATWTYHDGRFTSVFEPYVGWTVNDLGVGIYEIDQMDWAGGLRQKLEFAFHPAFVIRGGLDLAPIRTVRTTHLPFSTANYRPFPGETLSVDLQDKRRVYVAHDLGSWVEAEVTFPVGLKILPSLRIDPFFVRGQRRFSADPRLVIRQELEKVHGTTLKGSVGLYHELPPLQFLDPENGNPQLPLQAAFQTSLGLERKLTQVINLDLTAFYNRRYHMAEGTSEVVTQPDGTLRYLNYDGRGVGRSYGVELFLRHEITQKFFGWVAYTLSWSQLRRRQDDTYHFANFDQRHILTLIGQYKFGSGWELGGRYRLVTGNPTTPYVFATFDSDTGAYRPFAGRLNSARLNVFSQLDIRIDKVWLYDRWSLGIYLDVQNVLNQRNQEFILNDYRYRTQQAIPGIPILPTLGVKGTF